MQAPTFVNPTGLAPGRGYTHVVDVPAGRTIYVAGQVAFDEKGNLVGPGDVRAQTEQVFRNLRNTDGYSGKCGRCEFRKVCGGCRARAYEISGDYMAEEPYCVYEPT